MGGRRGRDILQDRITAALLARSARPAQLARALADWEDQQTRDTRWSARLARSRPVCDLRRAYWGEILRRVERRVSGRQQALHAARHLLADHGRDVSVRTWERVRALNLASPYADPFWGRRGAIHWRQRTLTADPGDMRDWLDLAPEVQALYALQGSMRLATPAEAEAQRARLGRGPSALERMLTAYVFTPPTLHVPQTRPIGRPRRNT